VKQLTDEEIQQKLNKRDPKYTFFMNRSLEILSDFKERPLYEIEEFLHILNKTAKGGSNYGGLRGTGFDIETEDFYQRLLE